MEIIPVKIQKEIEPGDNLFDLISTSTRIQDGDILVIAQKIISKKEGRLVDLSTVTPSLLAQGISSQYQKDPRIVELILSESKKIVRMDHGVIIVETKNGFVCANAGIDESNVKEGFATLLPVDSDLSAKAIHDEFKGKFGFHVPVIISDTFGRPFRMGQTNFAIGVCGISPILDYAGTKDVFDRELRVTAIATADELCCTAELVMEKTSNSPVAIIRNYIFKNNDKKISELLRPETEDLFR